MVLPLQMAPLNDFEKQIAAYFREENFVPVKGRYGIIPNVFRNELGMHVRFMACPNWGFLTITGPDAQHILTVRIDENGPIDAQPSIMSFEGSVWLQRIMKELPTFATVQLAEFVRYFSIN